MPEFYDRVKAHEYYLRTRKLKGRKPAAAKPALSSIKPGTHATPKKAGIGKKASVATKKSPAQLRSDAQARVASIKGRLAKLESALKALLKETKSSKTKTKTPEKAATKSKSTSDTHLTAAQKNAKKRANKEYYDKHKKPAEKKTGTHEMTDEQKIEHLRSQIRQARAQLKAAVAQARRTSKPANGMKGR